MSPEMLLTGDRPSENWPEKEFLETALQTWLGDPNLKVKDFVSRIATNKGDNYTSDMFRVKAVCEHRNDPLTIVIKRMKSGSTADVFINSTAHQREEGMLKIILPEIYSTLRKIIPDAEPFGAGYVYSTPGVLAMEDLQKGGFRMAQRLLGLDLDHCSLVIRTMARYHAASVQFMERKSFDLSVYRKSIFGEPEVKAAMDAFCTGMVRTLADELKTIAGLEKYSTKISELADRNFLSLLKKDVEVHGENDFLVISHGDIWTNNMLFRYSSSGKPEGVKFVDWQITTISSPCIDLQYFLTTSCNETVRTTCFDQLMEEYHETLRETMAALKCNTQPPTFEKLKTDFDKKTHYGMFGAFNVMPIALEEPGLFDWDDMVESGKPQNELFKKASGRNRQASREKLLEMARDERDRPARSTKSGWGTRRYCHSIVH